MSNSTAKGFKEERCDNETISGDLLMINLFSSILTLSQCIFELKLDVQTYKTEE
jgi:hypothetical protein